MSEHPDIIIAGCFGRVHGIKGHITIHSYTEPRENILNYSERFAFVNRQWQPVKLLDIQVTEKHILARIEGTSSREQAAAWTHVAIGIDRHRMPVLPEGDFYWHQLIGMQVVNLQDEVLGVVKEMLSTGANDVLIVEGSKRYLVPYLPEQVVSHVDLRSGVIRVDWDADF